MAEEIWRGETATTVVSENSIGAGAVMGDSQISVEQPARRLCAGGRGISTRFPGRRRGRANERIRRHGVALAHIGSIIQHAALMLHPCVRLENPALAPEAHAQFRRLAGPGQQCPENQ
jgi:hypothetical protein